MKKKDTYAILIIIFNYFLILVFHCLLSTVRCPHPPSAFRFTESL